MKKREKTEAMNGREGRGVIPALARRLRLLGLAAVLGVACAAVSAPPAEASVASTKHNFGSLSPAAVKSAETTEICVFCHTPHNSAPDGPIWNRESSGATYDVYASDSLAATLSPNSPDLGQPTGSSKLCLSCHDGTIAIGSLLNLPGKGLAGSMAVEGPGVDVTGKLTPASTSYIGTDLRDDHPISFEYGRSYPSNPEVKDPASLPPEVKLDENNMIQCVSCHDPHGTAFDKFLVTGLDNGGLCLACHDKRYWDTNPTIHSTSTATWNGSGQNPWREDLGAPGFSDDTPALQSCLACHSSHNGAAAMSLLRGANPLSGNVEDEEWSCLNCHNGNVATEDIDSTLNSLRTHDVKGTYGAHNPSRVNPGEPTREAAVDLDTANRHAECADCHNPHAAKSGNHTQGGINGNIIGPNLLGSWGVKPSPWGTPGQPTTTYEVVDFTDLTPGLNNLEGYLCLKCHSYYAYQSFPPNVPSGNADGTLARQSDPSADFNPSNFSYHPVFNQGTNLPPNTANPNWPANNLGLTNTFRYLDYPGTGPRDGFYNMTHNSTVTCTDCHSSSDPTAAEGPHGSGRKWILRQNEVGTGTTANLCYNCHRRDVYGDEGYVGVEANFSRVTHPVDGLGTSSPFYSSGTNAGNSGNEFGILCLTCHGGAYDPEENAMKGVHGSNAPAGTTGQALGYRMMNGACVESYTAPTTTTAGEIVFRTVDPAVDPVCNGSFGTVTIPATQVNYNCSNVADCSF